MHHPPGVKVSQLTPIDYPEKNDIKKCTFCDLIFLADSLLKDSLCEKCSEFDDWVKEKGGEMTNEHHDKNYFLVYYPKV